MDPTLYVILDRAAARGRDLTDLLESTIAGGCHMVQLREKEWPSGRLWPLAERLRARCRAAGVTFIVNDRVDLALALDADGVHLGQDDLPPRVARPLLRRGMILGLSTHSLEKGGRGHRSNPRTRLSRLSASSLKKKTKCSHSLTSSDCFCLIIKP